MLPLFVKDGLVIAYLASSAMFYIMADLLLDQLHLTDNTIPSSKDEEAAMRRTTITTNKPVENVRDSTAEQTIRLHSSPGVTNLVGLIPVDLTNMVS